MSAIVPVSVRSFTSASRAGAGITTPASATPPIIRRPRGRGRERVTPRNLATSASRAGTGNWSPPAPGTPFRSASTSLNPRDRTSGRRSRGLSDVLAGRGTFSRVTRRSRGPDRGEDGPLDAEDPAGIASALRNAPCRPGPACAMRAQRDEIHPGSRRAIPARRNPPALDSRDPTSHNASPGDITNSTPPGPAPGSPTPKARPARRASRSSSWHPTPPGRRAAGTRRPGPPQRTATRSKSASATTSSCAPPASATCPAAEA